MPRYLDIGSSKYRQSEPWVPTAAKTLAFAVIGFCCTFAYTHSAGRALAAGLLCGLLWTLIELAILGFQAARIRTAWFGVLNSSECGSYTLDYSNERFYASDAWHAMLGYTDKTAPQTRKEYWDLIEPSDREAAAQALAAYLERRTDCISCEFRIKRGDGRWQWIRNRSKVVEWNRQGQPRRLVGITWDIDGSKRAAELRAETNHILESVFSSLPVHIAVLHGDGTILIANDGWRSFEGAPDGLGARPAIGQNYLQLLRDAGARGDRVALDALATAHSLFAGEYVAPEDVTRSLEYECGIGDDRKIFSFRLIRFDLSTGPRLTVIHRDVTTSRRAEQSLRESEERWKFAIDGSGDAVWDWDIKRNSIYRSAQFFKMLGGLAEAGTDRFDRLESLMHPDDRTLVSTKYAGLISGSQDLCALEYRLKHSDGSWRWIMARCTVMVRDDERRALRILGVHTDITSLKQVESQLRAKQAENRMLALVAEHTTNSVLITDAKGHIEWANRGFEAMTGYSLSEVRGKKPGWVLQGSATDSACVDLMRRKIAAAEAVRVRILNFRKDRKPFWASIEIQPVRASGGAVDHFVAVMEDITEKEKIEAERRLSQKLQSVGQLAAGIAHEINTPIQFVGDSIAFLDEAWQEIQPLIHHVRTADGALGEVHTQTSGADVELDDEDVDFLLDNFPIALSRAKDGVQRIGGIVRAMKEFAHPEHGDFSHADVNRALENAAIVARNEYKYVGRTIIESASIPAVRCRISSISQVLLNLIVNAGHALADQGRTPETGQITLKTWADGDWVVISVADNGCGIADDIKDRIFDPFFTSKEVGRGTGQGLAIARAIVVEQHAGRLLVKSTLGEGSTFEVWLPKEGPPTTSSVPDRVALG